MKKGLLLLILGIAGLSLSVACGGSQPGDVTGTYISRKVSTATLEIKSDKTVRIEAPGDKTDEYKVGKGEWRLEGETVLLVGSVTTFRKDPRLGEQVIGVLPLGSGKLKVENNSLRDLASGEVWEKKSASAAGATAQPAGQAGSIAGKYVDPRTGGYVEFKSDGTFSSEGPVQGLEWTKGEILKGKGTWRVDGEVLNFTGTGGIFRPGSETAISSASQSGKFNIEKNGLRDPSGQVWQKK